MMAGTKTKKASAKKKEPARKSQESAIPDEQTVRWNLEDLPTSQHRAGLAGLVMMVQWLNRQGTHKGACVVEKLDAHGATFRFDRAGFQSLMDHTYEASEEEQEREQPLKDKKKQIIAPLREVTRRVTDAKGKEREKTFYVYPVTVPHGAVVTEWEPPSEGGKALWLKMWRDLLWGVLRGVPATRAPYEQRAERKPMADAAALYDEIARDPVVPLPSTYFLGAQAKTAEDVGFKDQARRQFVLHFWPFAIRIYTPITVDREGKEEFTGFAVAFPDVSDLRDYCETFPSLMRGRGVEAAGYRPRESKVDLALEAGVDLMWRLRRLVPAQLEASQGLTAFSLRGVDVVHVEKQGNNVRVWSSTRVEPKPGMLNEYGSVKGVFWSADFRRQRLVNLVAGRDWHAGFLGIFKTAPWERFLGDKQFFGHDARAAFKAVTGAEAEMDEGKETEAALETIVLKVVRGYLARKMEAKHGVKTTKEGDKWVWVTAEGKPAPDQEGLSKRRHKLAVDAFLGCRSRTGADFQDYFTGTLCSVPQYLGETGYRTLSTALLRNDDTVRTLTMLALSASA
ncbi:MAG: type I-MYXAN CRISPR-associated protein Cmx8 [Myxococcota bacterium]